MESPEDGDEEGEDEGEVVMERGKMERRREDIDTTGSGDNRRRGEYRYDLPDKDKARAMVIFMGRYKND